MQLDNGRQDVAAVEEEIARSLPTAVVTSISSVQVAKAERAIEPESIALGVFGAIAALAALLIAGQVIGRQLRFGADDLSVLRSLGAGPALTVADGLVGIIGAVVLGALLAAGVAVALSPLAPLGPVRSGGAFTSHRVRLDGARPWIAGAHRDPQRSGVRARVPRRAAPSRPPAARDQRPRVRGWRGRRRARGCRRPRRPGSASPSSREAARTPAPVRSAIVGGALAIVVVVATVIFGASLNTLVSRPPLYGWNWSYELRSGYSGISNIPERLAVSFLDRDKNIAAWTGVYFASMRLDDLIVPVVGTTPHAPVAPSQLSGHTMEAANQIVLAPGTLAQLHKRVGDTVEAGSGAKRNTTDDCRDRRIACSGDRHQPAYRAGNRGGRGRGPHSDDATAALAAVMVPRRSS